MNDNRRITWLLLAVYIFIENTVAIQNDVDNGNNYNHYVNGRGWLKFQQVPTNWREAYARCKYEGGTLVSPTDQFIHSSMLGVMKDYKAEAVFTGVSAIYSSEDFVSVEGTRLHEMPVSLLRNNYTTYASGNCLILRLNGTMENVSCSRKHNYICFISENQRNVDWNETECGTPDTGYKYSKITEKCYKYHSEGRTWKRAYMICAAEGGHLAVVDHSTEARVIWDIVRDSPEIPKSQWKDHVSIGMYEWELIGWQTIFGESITNTFSKWRHAEPNNASPGQDCGALLSNGELDDIWCEQGLFAFVCEMTPHSWASRFSSPKPLNSNMIF